MTSMMYGVNSKVLEDLPAVLRIEISQFYTAEDPPQSTFHMYVSQGGRDKIFSINYNIICIL